jgi:hypothetical protein
MQTFLPYPDFYESAKCLDWRRLGKQRVEAWQIFVINKKIDSGELNIPWQNHPAVLMWRGYSCALADYGVSVCKEWINRGYKDTMMDKFQNILIGIVTFRYPPWLGDSIFHASHRSNLLRKNPTWYGQYNWIEPPTYPYYWPVRSVK